MAELESDTVMNDAMSEVGLLYMDVLRAQATVDAREANVKLLQELVALVRSRRVGGMGTGLDMARAEAQLENKRQHLILARSEVEHFNLG